VLGCPIRKSADLMLVCSSPQLIAAYHVLLRLLEPRHPPCALICFKTIQIFKSLTSLKVTRYYNFFSQYVKELFPIAKDSLMSWLRPTRPTQLRVITSFQFQKNFRNLLPALRIATQPFLASPLRIKVNLHPPPWVASDPPQGRCL
jgi:hypothetical protein